MPYSGPDDPKLPKHIKQLPTKQRRRWAATWNSVYAGCQREGGEDCEGQAFRQANGVLKMHVNIDGIKVSLTELMTALKQQGRTTDQLREAQRKRAKRYGITVQAGGALTIPARFARLGAREADFADPTNFKYPIWLTKPNRAALSPAQLGQVQNAMVRFSQNKAAYDTKSRGVVERRINQARRKFKVGEFAAAAKGAEEQRSRGAGELAAKAWEVELAKVDEERRLIYGVALRPDVADSQGDIISAAEVEATAHRFMLDSQAYDLEHQGRLQKEKTRVVESYIAPSSMGAAIRKGDWVVASKVFDDSLWEMVRRGEIRGYSIKGRGRRGMIGERGTRNEEQLVTGP